MPPDLFANIGPEVWAIVLRLLPFIIIPILIIGAFRAWVRYVTAKNMFKAKWVLLEVRIPRNIPKSPLAMELFFANAFYQTYPASWYAKYVQGIVRSWFSLEIVSIEGNVYFFIKTQEIFKNLIESQIYAQYPQAEISEVEDYVNRLPLELNGEEWSMFGTEFKLKDKDAVPIKTYVDYGLDRSVGMDEEYKIDPITPMMEFLGSLGKGEQIWIQILVRASMKDWQKEGAELIKKLKEEAKPKEGEGFSPMTKGEQDRISAIERSLDKYGFDTGIRALYIAKKENHNFMTGPGLMSIIRQFNSNNLNKFVPSNVTGFKYPWQDTSGKRTAALKKEIFDAYRMRSFFYPPHSAKFVKNSRMIVRRDPFVLTTEELATIFHFPGQVAETPSFSRIESKKAEPPRALPM